MSWFGNASAAQSFTNTVEMLLRAGADVNAVNKEHRSSLLLATMHGNTDVVKALLQAGADANHADRRQRTSLIYASETGRKEMVRLLLDAGCNVNAADENQMTSLMLANRYGHHKIIELFVETGADKNQLTSVVGRGKMFLEKSPVKGKKVNETFKVTKSEEQTVTGKVYESN